VERLTGFIPWFLRWIAISRIELLEFGRLIIAELARQGEGDRATQALSAAEATCVPVLGSL